MKKNFLTGRVMFVLFTILIFGACKEESSSPGPDNGTNVGLATASLIINGSGYINRTFSFSVATGVHSPVENETGIAAGLSSGTDSVALVIVFPGNQTGTFGWSDTTVVGLFVYGTGGIQKTFTSYDGSGSTTVSSFGAVGGFISGTFSGKLIGGTPPNTTDTVTVSNGSFSAKRYY
ncbi:MAG: hypothetical protein QME52_13240 [Bacteroidota bacterium]|nr:hypothetical protein [Bacteroidota bacterium]